MKKALIVANLGGFASFLISDIDILQSMGYEVHYMANCDLLPWEDTRKKLIEKKVKIININVDSKQPFKIRNIKEYLKLKKLLYKEKYQLIHCHTPIVGLLVRVAARKLRKNSKVIYTTHGFTFNKESSKMNWIIYNSLEKFASRFCDAIITINKEDYKNAKNMLCPNVFLINGMGVDINKYKNTKINKQEYRKQLGIRNDKIMILSVGELSKRKNHQAIIQAIALLENKDKYVYAICGNGINGGTGKQLRQLAKELGVEIKLLGFRKDISEIMHCSDIGAIPSIREGLGLAGVESLAVGVPLVASNVQGIGDYVINGKTGILCSTFEYKEYADAIDKLSDKKYRESLKENCINESEKYDISISIQQRRKIYNKIIRGI